LLLAGPGARAKAAKLGAELTIRTLERAISKVVATYFQRFLSVRWSMALAVVLGLVLCFLPLTSTIGPESALVLALLLSPLAALMGVRIGLSAQGKPSSELLCEAVGLAWLLLAIPLALLALNLLRVDVCDPLGGLAFVALGPWCSLSLAAVLGVSASLLPRPRIATAIALAVPLLAIARALHDFLESPGIFAFGHFFGYFPGTFYDRQIEIGQAWWSHRLLSAVIGAGLWAFTIAARDLQSSRADLARLPQRPLLAALVAVAACAALLSARHSHALAHTTSSRHVAHSLGLIVEGPRCRAVVPRELERGEAQRLTEECELRISQLERALGVRESGRVTAYFFRSTQEKRALMGAARVYIAKPWRREAYLQLAGFPHPVLAHELAHVVARHAASGPFGVPGKLWGLIPEPTLIEGVAVALDPTTRDELTPHQWAKAAKRARVAPPISALLGPRFLAHNQALAYTLAGSFLRYVLDTYGAAKLRRIYRTGDVTGSLGKSFAQLEASWEKALAELPLPAHAEALARLRFERPGVFSQVCPHEIERLESELGAALGAGDLARAQQRCAEVLAIDPANTGTRATYAGTLAQRGAFERAKEQLHALLGPPAAPTATLARARALVADAGYARRDFEAARREYQELLRAPQPESDLRQLEVKLLALEAGEPTRSIIADLLIGKGGRPPDPRAAMHLIQRLYVLRRDGLAHYLEARQLMFAGRHDLAQPLIGGALERGLPTRRLRVEALRAAALAAFIVGALDEAAQHAESLKEDREASLAERAEASDFQQRIAFRRRSLAK
jgi:tetratricopeptide (TPR) repeat protein